MVDMEQFAEAVAQAISVATAPLLARIEVLEKRAVLHGRDGRDGLNGKDAVGMVGPTGERGEKGERGERGERGLDAPMPDVEVIAMKAAALVPVVDIDALVIKAVSSSHFDDAVRRTIRPVLMEVTPPVTKVVAASEPDIDVIAVKAAALVPKPTDGRDGRDGKDVDVDVLASIKSAVESVRASAMTRQSMEAYFSEAIAAIPMPRDGRDGLDADPNVIERLVTDKVAALPRPKDGVDGKDGRDGKDGKDGRDIDPAVLDVIVSASVEKSFAAMPRPNDGRSVTVDDVAPLIAAEVTKAVAALPKASDGVGVSDVIIDRNGELVMTFSDGRTKAVGVVTGANADPLEVKRLVTEAVDAIPRPKDGKDGADGRDGLGFDDTEVYLHEDKGYILRLAQGDRVKEQPIAIPVDRGVYKPGKSYHAGAIVTAQGALWMAQKDTAERPGDGATSWRLAVKKGRDGRDYVPTTGGQS